MTAWLDRLPHGPAFRYLTGVTVIQPGVSGEGVMDVGDDAPWIPAHFPEQPVVPGVLIIEAMAQLAGLVAWSEHGEPSHGTLAQVDVRLIRPVVPPATIRLEASVERRLGSLVRCVVQASHAGVQVCKGTLVLSGAAVGEADLNGASS